VETEQQEKTEVLEKEKVEPKVLNNSLDSVSDMIDLSIIKYAKMNNFKVVVKTLYKKVMKEFEPQFDKQMLNKLFLDKIKKFFNIKDDKTLGKVG